jgi:outer membrane protein TolC
LSGQKLASPLLNTEEYSARNYLTVTQPLLKGFGRAYNTAQIRIAQKESEVEELLLADRVEEILAAVENSYWELVYAIRSVEIAKEALDLAGSFLGVAESRLRAGAGIRVDVLEAQAARANREADLYSAENAVKDAEDLLRTLLRLTETPEMWAASIEPGGVPEVLPETPQLDSCLELAVEKRRDHRVLKLQIEEGDISIQAAKRDMLPSLDLFATYARSGLAEDPGPAYKLTWNENFREYTYGVQFNYPLGNHGARAGYDRATLTRDQARVSLRRLEDQIVKDVRTAWRRLSTELRRAAATREAERLAEQKLADMQSRYEAGRATSTDVFDFQEDLTRARVEVARAKINALEAATALLRGMGVLADTRGVTVE